MVKFEDFEKHRKELTFYARNLSKNKQKTEDLLQDTYIDFHEYLVKIDGNFRKPESLCGFLKIMLWRNWNHSRDLSYKRARFSFFEQRVDWSEDNGFNAIKTPSINDTDYSVRELFLIETIKTIRLKSQYRENVITKRQNRIINLLLNDFNQSEIAKKLECSRQSISDELTNIRRRMPKWIKTINN